ncbi:MAG: hypothetical protein V4488_18305 [Pseudomonadota bacterium]
MTIYENYLLDLGVLIKEMALDAKKTATDCQTDFAIGYMAGFHRVVSLMQQQAEAFGIPLEKLELNGIDPDTDLV